LGAQKSGTSWVYACLFEHPEICAPVKEIHFFSRPRFANGKDWYEGHFSRCGKEKLKGEFSTSYLYSSEAPERIKSLYPSAKLIAILRDPIDRAVSQYRNSIKAGEIDEVVTFSAFMEKEKSVLEQGLYAKQLGRYFAEFPREQILVLIYEDSKKDPKEFIRSIYRFLGVDEHFLPSMLYHEINVARNPKFIILERIMHKIAEGLRRYGLSRLVHFVRQSGLPDLVRSKNTKRSREVVIDRDKLKDYFRADVLELSNMLGRDLTSFWKIVT
jgi:hypothetical protein